MTTGWAGGGGVTTGWRTNDSADQVTTSRHGNRKTDNSELSKKSKIRAKFGATLEAFEPVLYISMHTE